MRVGVGLLVIVALLACAAVPRAAAPAATAGSAGRLPEFTHAADADWINSRPLSSAGLRGRPVLVEVWTFDCSNCLASLPWMQRIAARYASQGLAIVAVHTPELPHERDRAELRRAVARLAIPYPVMVDEDYSYWRALGNRYWPAFYLYDGEGRQVAARVGELHAGEAGADNFERQIASALAAGPPRGMR